MKIALQLLLALLLSTSVSTTLTGATDYTGTWEYIVSDTPNGEYKGKLVLSIEDDKYVDNLDTDKGKIDLKDVKVEKGK